MAVDERSRHALHSKLEKMLGEEEAVTLMELVPPVGWGEVATRRDLDALRGDMDALRSDFRDFRKAIRSDLGGVREETKNDVGDFRTAFTRDIDDIKSSIRDLRAIVDGHFRTTVFSLLTLFIALAGVVLVAVRLG